jgi:hypothetical protein
VTEFYLKALFILLILAAVLGLGPIVAKAIDPRATECAAAHSYIYCLLHDWID